MTLSKKRCEWAVVSSSKYIAYHDKEWGVPVHDDGVHFEFLILEGAQAGLSWSTILNKREGYRKAFASFDPSTVADFDDETIFALSENKNIVRNKLKIKSAISNARCFLQIQKEFGTFDEFVWGFVGGKVKHGYWTSAAEVPSTSRESDNLSKELKKRGFNFVGSTIIYAYMQAIGLVNDHTSDCFRFEEVRNM